MNRKRSRATIDAIRDLYSSGEATACELADLLDQPMRVCNERLVWQTGQVYRYLKGCCRLEKGRDGHE